MPIRELYTTGVLNFTFSQLIVKPGITVAADKLKTNLKIFIYMMGDKQSNLLFLIHLVNV